ncbi:MAG: L,D-transpeptidase family protein [Bacteroidales bacterium]|nr:L,D-transpeptidase family protein [Bacteroidales bacterium]
MIYDEELLEFDFPKTSRFRNFIYSVLVCIASIFCFSIFSSYHYPPKLQIDNAQIRSLIKLQINSIDILNDIDTSQDLNFYLNKSIVSFYKNRDYNPVWIENYQANNKFYTYKHLLDSAKYFGFPFDYFYSEKINRIQHNAGIQSKEALNNLIEFDLTTTFSCFKYLIYLTQGIIEKDTSAFFRSYVRTLPGYLSMAIKSDNFNRAILAVQPDFVQYERILNSMSFFVDLNLSIANTTPAFIDDKILAEGFYYSDIISVRKFDSQNTKIASLHKFQKQFNLPNDSILSKLGHKILVKLLHKKYQQACLNLHRLRQLGNSSKNCLFVNIPEFKLTIIEGNKTKDVFKIIVGKKKTPTPIFSSNVEKVITKPYWTVPRSIVANEIVRRVRRDSTYLKRNGYFVIDNYEDPVDDEIIDWDENDPLGKHYWLRQRNSRYSAMGQIKFTFPNKYQIYLHDTPSKRLFKNTNRSYSHGCIRIENPDKLAQYLYDNYHTEDDLNIKKLISSRKSQEIELDRKIDIHIQYITCAGTKNKELVFFKDIYNRDKEEIKAVFPNWL